MLWRRVCRRSRCGEGGARDRLDPAASGRNLRQPVGAVILDGEADGAAVPGPEDPANARIFEHASIPATVTNFFLGGDVKRTVREKNASTFLDLLSGPMRPDSDIPYFKL